MRVYETFEEGETTKENADRDFRVFISIQLLEKITIIPKRDEISFGCNYNYFPLRIVTLCEQKSIKYLRSKGVTSFL